MDNFGDIGVCWRLARALAARGYAVRLWVDDWATLARLCPPAAVAGDGLRMDGVELRRWTRPFPDVEPARLVVEAFACELPENHLAAMAARAEKPVWINLEYLSAEDWVSGVHGMASPHPRLPLTKYFCFPGFDARSGGLPRESGLVRARTAFQANPAARAELLSRSGGMPPAGALVVSLFAYGHPQLAGLLECWMAGPRPLCLLVPEGRLLADLAAALDVPALVVGDRVRRGALELRVLPFADQDGYDRLLWACDLNFVRGEDSFVRAQWAGRPLVWQPYRQQEDAHSDKLNAFLHRYCAGLGAQEGAVLRDLWQAWNREEGMAQHWDGFLAHRAAYTAHAELWARQMSALGDLAANLVAFCHQGKAR